MGGLSRRRDGQFTRRTGAGSGVSGRERRGGRGVTVGWPDLPSRCAKPLMRGEIRRTGLDTAGLFDEEDNVNLTCEFIAQNRLEKLLMLSDRLRFTSNQLAHAPIRSDTQTPR